MKKKVVKFNSDLYFFSPFLSQLFFALFVFVCLDLFIMLNHNHSIVWKIMMWFEPDEVDMAQQEFNKAARVLASAKIRLINAQVATTPHAIQKRRQHAKNVLILVCTLLVGLFCIYIMTDHGQEMSSPTTITTTDIPANCPDSLTRRTTHIVCYDSESSENGWVDGHHIIKMRAGCNVWWETYSECDQSRNGFFISPSRQDAN